MKSTVEDSYSCRLIQGGHTLEKVDNLKELEAWEKTKSWEALYPKFRKVVTKDRL